MKSVIKRISINLSKSDLATLNDLMAISGESAPQVYKRALQFLYQMQIRQGSKL